VIVATVGVVNLRHALYSAAVAEYLRALPWRWKLLLAYLLTFIVLLVLGVHSRTDAGAALVAGVVVLLAQGLPHKSGLLLAAGAGVLAGLLFRRFERAAR